VQCSAEKAVVVNCYFPPYTGRFNAISIWNTGKSVDSLFMDANKFDSSFIADYWKKNYQKLLPYAKVFHVRRQAPLILNNTVLQAR